MTVEEAQGLIQVLKRIMNTGSYMLPQQGTSGRIDLRSVFSDKDKFPVIINRTSRIRKEKYTLLLLYGKDQGLLRIDVGGPNHVNPDGTIVPCPHIHMQQRDTGHWDSWANDLPAVFGDSSDILETVKDFLMYCNANNITSIKICEQEEMGDSHE